MLLLCRGRRVCVCVPPPPRAPDFKPRSRDFLRGGGSHDDDGGGGGGSKKTFDFSILVTITVFLTYSASGEAICVAKRKINNRCFFVRFLSQTATQKGEINAFIRFRYASVIDWTTIVS